MGLRAKHFWQCGILKTQKMFVEGTTSGDYSTITFITGSLAEDGEDFFISSTRTSSLRRFGVMLSIIGRINSTHEEPRNCRVPLPDHQLQ